LMLGPPAASLRQVFFSLQPLLPHSARTLRAQKELP
jgi:hypothetical protein